MNARMDNIYCASIVTANILSKLPSTKYVLYKIVTTHQHNHNLIGYNSCRENFSEKHF